MEDIDGGLHPAVDGQSHEDDGFRLWPNLPTGPRLSTLYINMHM